VLLRTAREMTTSGLNERNGHGSIPDASRTPRFSVIIPTFNSGSTLGRALDSISFQSFRNFEVVIVDGASSDKTLDIIENFRQRELDIGIKIVSEKDNGIYDAMNKGIKISSGKYVYFLGSDDRLFGAGTLEQVSGFLSGNPGTDIVYGDIVFAGKDTGISNSEKNRIKYRLIYLKILDKIGVFLRLSVNHQAIFARREIMADGFSLRYRLASDYDWYLRQRETGRKFRHLRENVACFNVSGASSDLKPLISEITVIALRHFAALFARRRLSRKRLPDGFSAAV
jgi:glycosyltransferase involved in cell wall biosynthesis